MGASTTTQSRNATSPQKSSGPIRLQATSPARPKFQLRSASKRFWHTDHDGVARLVNNHDPSVVPENSNAYTFDPAEFTHEPYPSTFPPGRVWPPRRIEDIMCHVGELDVGCVGASCWTDEMCDGKNCEHTLAQWTAATEDWDQHVELRATGSRGIGVFTKRSLGSGTVLGWYAGEVKTLDGCSSASDYLMEIEIGETDSIDVQDPLKVHEPQGPTVFIDAEKKGNWTRFINHSCNPYAVFCCRRVGNMRIMTVETVRRVPRGAELTVGYGEEYYGLDTIKVCWCGMRNCVGEKRRRMKMEREERGLGSPRRGSRVKKCRRLAPP